MELQKSVDGAIPGTFPWPFGSLVSSCHLNVSSSSLFAHFSGGPGRGEGALDRVWLEAHTIVRHWGYMFRFDRMENSARGDVDRPGPSWRVPIHRENEPIFSVCLTLEKNLVCAVIVVVRLPGLFNW